MKNGQKSDMRRERKMTFDDFNEDPFDGISAQSFFQNSNINVDDFFRTPERHRAARDRAADRGFGGSTASSSNCSSSSTSGGGNNSNFNNIKANMFDKDFDFDFPSKNFDKNAFFSRSSSSSSTGGNNHNKNQSTSGSDTNSNSKSKSEKEQAGKYSVSIPLGSNIEPEDLKITLKDHQMTIDVKKEGKSQGRGTSSSYQEFKKQFNLPLNVDMKQLTSVLTADGSLKIEAPYLK